MVYERFVDLLKKGHKKALEQVRLTKQDIKQVEKIVPVGLARLSVLTCGGARQAYVTYVGGAFAVHDELHFRRFWSSATTGDYVELKFRGTILIVLFGIKTSDRGIANVYVDGKLVKKVDLYAPIEYLNHTEFISDQLSPEEHTVRIEVSGERNPSSVGYRIDVQGILVDPKVNLHADIYHESFIRDIGLRMIYLVEGTECLLETTTPLAAGAEYIGTALDRHLRTHAWFHAMAFADVDGTIYIDQSLDGTNWDLVSSTSLTGGTGKALSVRVVARYVRIRYVNGTVAQTVFRFGRRFTFA